jgi:hypothetical protein
MRWVLAIVIVMLAAPAWGEEVLYCAETGVGKGATFIVKVISETQRTITNTTGDKRTIKYKCRRPLAMLSSSNNEDDRTAARRIVCGSGSGKAPWVFHDGTFARANLVGSTGGDTNIAYGICVKN